MSRRHRSPRRRAIWVLVATSCLALAGPTAAWAQQPTPAPDDPIPVEPVPDHTPGVSDLSDLSVTTTQVASGLQRPTAIFAPDDGSGRLLITEKAGTVRAYHPDTGLGAEPLLDIRDRVDVSGNERGLLGITAAPDFATAPALYVAYTSLPDGALTLSRFVLDAPDQQPVPADAEQVVLNEPHAEFSNHNGGQLAFGPDGHLYWSLGDGGGADDVLDNGQDLGTLLGAIARIDVRAACGGVAYCVPGDNPFVDRAGARPEIWAYGLRNPWRFSFDPHDGSLWIADVGQGTFEEVNHLAAGEAGANLGWSCREGMQVFDETRCADDAAYVEPVFQYRTSIDGCAIIGGHVYRGAAFADVAGGTYIATDYCSATAFALRPSADGSGYESARIGELPVQPTSLGVDTDGELYLVNDLPGQLHRLSFAGPEPAPTCAVTYQVDSEWDRGFVASVTVENTGDEAIDGWTATWTFPDTQRVEQGWNAAVTQDGAEVTAEHAAWNGALPPGGTVRFGLLGAHDGRNPAPDAFALNGRDCS